MNGSKSPDATAAPSEGIHGTENGALSANGHRNSSQDSSSSKTRPATGIATAKHKEDTHMSDAEAPGSVKAALNGSVDADDAASEAETLISSPVKRRELEKSKINNIKTEPSAQENTPDLSAPRGESPVPEEVPTPGQVTDEQDTEPALANGTPKNEEFLENGNGDGRAEDAGQGSESEDLSDFSSHASSRSSSRASSRSRANTERRASTGNDAESPNPRKRKHRASSVSLPNKRPSIDKSKRRLRKMHSGEHDVVDPMDRSPSPKLRSHRRTASTQSGHVDGSVEGSSNRKRRALTQFPVREPKSAKNWEGSDASSETTSIGHAEQKRSTRGVGRSTSTPGRPLGREHKRYVSKYGFTRMAEACEAGDLDAVKEWRTKDPDQLELAEFAGNTPLQIAALNGNAEIVEYLIGQGVRVDVANGDKDTPLLDAAENGHVEVVQALLNAGVDPMRTNVKGKAALDVVDDETDNADEIRTALREAIDAWNSDGAKQRREEEEARFASGPSKGLHFMARTYENMLKLVQDNDRNGVREFLDARVSVDNALVAAAAKTGDTYLVNMLLAEMTDKKRYQKPEKPMLAVLGTSHFEMVKSLTMTEQFNALYHNRQGKSWPELAEERQGPNWRQEKELLQGLFDVKSRELQRRSSSPVTKFDATKRKPVRKLPNEDSDDEREKPKKNGRRLVPRKDLRAARPASDSSSEESDDSDAPNSPEETAAMKPPESHPARPRTKSFSAQGSWDNSPKTRRRSSSLRGPSELPLPSVEEQPQKEEMEEMEDEMDDARASKAAREKEAKLAQEKAEAEAQQRQQEEAQAKAEAEAEAEAKRKEAELERQRVEAARHAEELKRQQEEEIKAEQARQAREKQRLEQEFAEQRLKFRSELVAALPSAVARALDARLEFDFDSIEGRQYIARHFTPLQAVSLAPPGSETAQPAPGNAEPYILNLQAAPLLGEQGWEIFMPSESRFAADSLHQKWDCLPVQDVTKIQQLLTKWPPYLLVAPSEYDDLEQDTPYSEELFRAAGRANALKVAMRQTCNNEQIVLQWVKLGDVIKALHPSLKQMALEVMFEMESTAEQQHGAEKEAGFVSRLNRANGSVNRSNVKLGDPLMSQQSYKGDLGMTKVTVVHEK